MPSQKSFPVLALLMMSLLILMGMLITGFFAFSPLSYVQLDISIKTWCMFINGLLWMSLVWIVHMFETETVKKLRISHLKEIFSYMDKVAKFFYLSGALLKVLMTVIGTSVLIISILQLHSLEAGKAQIWTAVGIFIFMMASSIFLIFRELSSVRK